MDANGWFSQARQMLEMGHTAEAQEACRRTLELDPNHPDAVNLLGITLVQQGQWPQAADMLGRAAELRPDVPEIHANLGHALRAAGRLDQAVTALERAIALRPDYALAYNNLGMVYRAQGRLEESAAAYRRALEIVPNLVPANFNLANVLKEMGQFAEAANVCRRVVGLIPSNPDAHVSLAGVLESLGDAAGARQSYEAALRLSPSHAIATVNFALMLKRQGQADESLALLRRAEASNPSSADVQEKLGRALWDEGIYEDGLARFEAAVRLRPTPVTRVAAATLVPPVYTSLEQVKTWRQRLVREVGTLRQDGVKIDLINHVARSPFYVPYAGLDDRDVLRDIAALHQPPGDPAQDRHAPGERVRVAFISSFFREHTIGLWTQGLIAKLPREKLHVTVLSCGRYEDAVARFIRSSADQFIEVPSTLAAARGLIAGLGLDVLIYTDLGMEGFTYSLAFNRLASVQCAMWGHPATSGISTIDYYISSDLAEAEGAEANYTEKLVRLKDLPLHYLRPPPPPKRERRDFGLPADGHLYGCLHSVFKLHPEFDFVIGELLGRDPTGVVVIPRSDSANWERLVLDRIRAAYSDVMGRVCFIDRLPRDLFRALNQVCDVTLAPFPFGAGDTSMEAFAAGAPVVTLRTPYLRGNFTSAMYRVMEMDDCVANTPQEYVEIALRLASDSAWRRDVVERIQSRSPKLFEQTSGVTELAQFLESAARDR